MIRFAPGLRVATFSDGLLRDCDDDELDRSEPVFVSFAEATGAPTNNTAAAIPAATHLANIPTPKFFDEYRL